MIHESQQHANSVVEQALLASLSLNTIVDSATDIIHMNEQIANAAIQQHSAAQTLNENINSINDMSVQNLQGSEQNLIANMELATINAQLEESVKQFKL
ncbi:MAG: hypothetical protein MJK10_00070 [Pseudomonadales bacterium]|nr:hypothetical protein [Pseudomonadales bacterium]NRA14274.1 hypothetical protein [Oceanospirillaceae bacterium]